MVSSYQFPVLRNANTKLKTTRTKLKTQFEPPTNSLLCPEFSVQYPDKKPGYKKHDPGLRRLLRYPLQEADFQSFVSDFSEYKYET